jgi:hypothetical protein
MILSMKLTGSFSLDENEEIVCEAPKCLKTLDFFKV